MSAMSWKTGFHQAMIHAIIRLGIPLADEKDRSNFGFGHPHSREIIRKHKDKPIYYDDSTYSDADWWEFTDSFSDDAWVHGLDAEVHYKNGDVIMYRYSGSFETLLKAVLAE